MRSGGLKAELPDRKECEGLLHSAIDRLKDAHNPALSFASRFDLAYNAAHGLALTALRLQGYRSDRRYLVFQYLVHTIDVGKAQIRLFALCHERRIWRCMKATWTWTKPYWLTCLPHLRQATANAE